MDVEADALLQSAQETESGYTVSVKVEIGKQTLDDLIDNYWDMTDKKWYPKLEENWCDKIIYHHLSYSYKYLKISSQAFIWYYQLPRHQDYYNIVFLI